MAMDISYVEAIDLILGHASQQNLRLVQELEDVSISQCLHRICAVDVLSPSSTPKFDTSAMDGYAVSSNHTQHATPENPITFCVKGTMAAGQGPLLIPKACENDVPSCVEIMTGAQFPVSTEHDFDACVRVEDTCLVESLDSLGTCIQITKPALPNQNRRFAGTDFRQKDVVVRAGTTVKPRHIMALAALGIRKIKVYRHFRIGVISTGSELISTDQPDRQDHIYDTNGPYISAALISLGIDVVNLGIAHDDGAHFTAFLAPQLEAQAFDMIITTGAVSKGKFDFVRSTIESLGAKILFHRVKVRPGHPILMATLQNLSSKRTTTFFGLPGNPLAAAACLRFFVEPCIAATHGQFLEASSPARLTGPVKVPQHLHVFLHGQSFNNKDGTVVHASADQGSGKIKPFLEANCWISIPPGRRDDEVRTVQTYQI